MKKLLGIVLGCMVLCVAAYAQKDDPFLYRGELTAKDVIELMKKNEFLPLSVNVPRYFEDEAEKAEVVAVAVDRVKKNDNYLNNYNAAVVYATADDLQGVDFGRHVNDEDSNKAVKYATRAIELSPNTPYMYILRATVNYERAYMFSIEGSELVNKKYAEQADADMAKAYELNPTLFKKGIQSVPLSENGRFLKKIEKLNKASVPAVPNRPSGEMMMLDERARSQQAVREALGNNHPDKKK